MSMDIHNDIIVHYIVHIQGITVMLNKSITNFRKKHFKSAGTDNQIQ